MTSEKIRRWLGKHPYWGLALITLAILAPFLGKPFNIDDPLYIWTGQFIQMHPGNPYHFSVNWDFTTLPMRQVTDNPPGICYYAAVMGWILGWSEWGMHTAFLLPALAVVLGTYRLAGRFCEWPFLAGLMALFMPVLLISADTVMCDVPMLAFWVWAVVYWVEGLQAGSTRKLAVAGGFMALAELMKYNGACLVPLLAAYALALRKPPGGWVPYVIIPVLVLVLHEYVTSAVYGYSVLSLAMGYSKFSHDHFGIPKFQSIVCGLAFTGGCLAPVMFFAPVLWRKRGLTVLVATAATVTTLVFLAGMFWDNRYMNLMGMTAWLKVQLSVWIVAGLGILALILANVWQRRDAGSVLLALWVGGTFVFASICNWTVNARSILPMAPAVAILIVQWLEKEKRMETEGMKLALVLSAMFAMLALAGDYSRALAVRASAGEVVEKYGHGPGTLWFEGHWGFQFYMMKAGARGMDFQALEQKRGDILAMPLKNVNLIPPDSKNSELVDVITAPVPGGLVVFDKDAGAGFYASSRGPLPFVLGWPKPEMVNVYYLKPPGP